MSKISEKRMFGTLSWSCVTRGTILHVEVGVWRELVLLSESYSKDVLVAYGV